MFANSDQAKWWRPAMLGRAAVGVFMIGHLIAGTTGPSTQDLSRTAAVTTVVQTPAAEVPKQPATAPSADAAGKAAAPKPGATASPTKPGTSPTKPNASAPQAEAKPAAPAKPTPPSQASLLPQGTPSGQVAISLTDDQIRNARAIIETGQKMNLPPRAWVIAVGTSLQETKLHNYGDLGTNNDHDSLGLFQQRPSSGWGSPEQIIDPAYAATQFYKGLERISGWQELSLTDAAQAVQVSAFPDAYAQWEQQAANLVLAVYGAGPYAAQADQAK